VAREKPMILPETLRMVFINQPHVPLHNPGPPMAESAGANE